MDSISPNQSQDNIFPRNPRGRKPKLNKACIHCGENNPDKFGCYTTRRGRKMQKGICKKCDSKQQVHRQKNNPEKYSTRMKQWRKSNPEYHRTYWLNMKYNLSPEEYQTMFEAQSGLCAICGMVPRHGKLNVDHCHISGAVRGLLCTSCNQMLGRVNDDPETLMSAIEYLKLYPN